MSMIATVGMMHVCPMFTGPVPHVGGPVAVGMPDLLTNVMPTATVGSVCTCVGPPDSVMVGLPILTINGMPAAVVGSVTAHGGTVTLGMPDFIV